MVDLPPDHIIRRAQHHDRDVVCALVIAQQIADFGEPMTTEAKFHAEWARHLKERILYVVDAPDGETVACLSLVRAQNTCYLILSQRDTVHCESITRVLVAEAEQIAIRCAIDDDHVLLKCQVSERNGLMKRVVEESGFSSNLSFLMMEIMLNACVVPTPDELTRSLPDGILIRPFVVGRDERAVYEADEEANQDKSYASPMTYEQWIKRMGMVRPEFDPSLWLLACAGDTVCGVALNTHYRNMGVIDHLGVRRAWRKRGIGMALMKHTYATFFARGIRRIQLNVDAHNPTRAPDLYRRAGMAVVNQYHIYSKVISSGI